MAAAELMQEARIAIREGHLVDARRLLRQVIHEEPKNHAAWLLLARATPDKKLASQYIDRARHLQPDSPLVQRAQDDLAANKTAATNKFSLSWLLIPLLVGTVLILGIVGLGYSKNAREHDVLTPYKNVDRVAAAPADLVQVQPTEIPETDSVDVSTPGINSPPIIPTVSPSPAFDNEAVEDPGEIHETIFEPLVISNPDQALPAAILMGIDKEAASSEAAVVTEEEIVSPVSSQEDVTEEESRIEAAEETEIINPPEISGEPDPNNATDDADIDEAVAEEGVADDVVADNDEEIENLEQPGDEAIMEDNATSNDPAQIASGERWIDVNLTTQTLTAYEGETPVLYSVISSGLWQFPTVTGQFRTWIKYESQDMTGYHLGYNYSLDDVPHVMYFFEDYAIHGAYWHNNFGTPMSHGCVNVNLTDAAWLYNWAPLGTLVNVHH